MSQSADLLETIIAGTRRIVAVREAQESLSHLAQRAEQRDARSGAFKAALARRDRVNVIAECKRRSPSRGVLRRDYDARSIATSYAASGAAAISVLTEPTFFDGSLADLEAVAGEVRVPVLRKDFVVSSYQILEARAAGASAVLLIVAALTDRQLRRLGDEAKKAGLDALVEVHDANELQRAVDAGAEMVGVNNRNLRTLEVNVAASEELMARMPAGVVAVSESGLKSADDLIRLRTLGYSAFLIGERCMTEPDPGVALRALLDAAEAGGRRQEAGGCHCS
jgi:indole-3-glycerol phosphate synthase